MIKIHNYNHNELRRFLHIQLRSLNTFLDRPSLYEFMIICKDDEISVIQKALLEHPSPLPIKLIPETSIVKSKVITNTPGWYFQQLLKLGVARIVKTPLYLILDADCFLTKPFAYKDLFHEGKIIMDKESWTNQPHWWFDSIGIIEGVSLNELASQPAIAVTPQIVVTEIVCQLLDYLDAKDQDSSWDEYLSPKTFTEFSLYWLFVIKNKKLDLYQLSGGPSLSSNALWLHLLRFMIPSKRSLLSRLWKRISIRQARKEQVRRKALAEKFKALVEKQIKTSFEANHYFHFSLIQSSIDEIEVEWIIEQTNRYLM